MNALTLRRRVATLAIASIAAASLTALGGWADAAPAQAAPLGVQRSEFTSGSSYLVVEVLDDDLVHFEVAGGGTSPGTSTALFTTPQIAKTDYPGPETYTRSGGTIQTAGLRLDVDTSTLCVTATDITRTPELVLQTTCPVDLTQAWKGLDITKSSMENAYGLGQQFFTGASADGDWVGRVRSPGGTYGNAMVYDAENGPVGNTQIPVLFAVGDANANYGLFVDQLYKQEWNLTGDPWTMRTWGDQLRWYLMAGPDLPDLREDYMQLTGTPPVPPKKAFGLWVSEFGYDDWSELDDTISGLRAADFPVDGAMLDVQWFGGVTADSDDTRMGTLDWDTTIFPNPASKIAALKADGVGIIPIEESYVGKNLPEHADMAADGYLVRSGCSTCSPAYLTGNPWWGKGGMIDWTQPAAGAAWHDEQRQHLVQRQQLAVRVLRRPRLMQQRLVQLVAEHQRQPRDAQHQQEQGRDQARPLVRPGPGADRPGVHRPARIRTRSRPTDARSAARPASDSSIPDSRRPRPTDPRPRHSRPAPATSPACRPPQRRSAPRRRTGSSFPAPAYWSHWPAGRRYGPPGPRPSGR